MANICELCREDSETGITMKNYGICHSCRSPNHSLPECPKLRKCPKSECYGILRFFEVGKKTANFGRLFDTCSECDYFKWRSPLKNLSKGETSGESICKSTSKAVQSEDAMDGLSRVFEKAQITDEEDVEITMSVTVRIGKGKGKGKTDVNN